MQMKLFLAADDIAMSLEVCPETWTAQKILRLHIHMFFKSNSSFLRFRPKATLGGRIPEKKWAHGCR